MPRKIWGIPTSENLRSISSSVKTIGTIELGVTDMSTLTQVIKHCLSQYASGDLTPDSFQEQFSAAFQRAFLSSDGEAQTLCEAVEWARSDFHNGQLSLEQFREEMRVLAADKQGSVLFGQPLVVGGFACPSGFMPSDTSVRVPTPLSPVVLMGEPCVLRETAHVS
jgi:hypothetical protein